MRLRADRTCVGDFHLFDGPFAATHREAYWRWPRALRCRCGATTWGALNARRPPTARVLRPPRGLVEAPHSTP